MSDLLKVATDCSGVGAPEEALKGIGIKHRVVFACEIDKYAKKTYLANHTCETMVEDITKRDNSGIEQVDLYVAGFPCQAFSIAGKRGGFDDTRGTILFNCADFIRQNRPRFFILENVKGLLSHDKKRTFATIYKTLCDLGYQIHFKVLNTLNFGIPQNRERVFIVGLRDAEDSFSFPDRVPLKLRLRDLLEMEVDEKYYLSERMIYFLKQYSERKKAEGHGFCFRTLGGDDIARTITARYHKMGTDDYYYLDDSADAMVVQRGRGNNKGGLHEVCPTITINSFEHNNFVAQVEERIRRFTPRECFRLQGFPNSFKWNVSDTQAYKQAGNSMTVHVIEAIIRKLLPNLQNQYKNNG